MKWYDSWSLDVFADCDRFKRPAELADGMEVRLLDKYSDRWMSTKGAGSPIFMARPVSISKKELEDAIQGEMLNAAIEARTAEVNEAR